MTDVLMTVAAGPLSTRTWATRECTIRKLETNSSKSLTHEEQQIRHARVYKKDTDVAINIAVTHAPGDLTISIISMQADVCHTFSLSLMGIVTGREQRGSFAGSWKFAT